MKYLLIDFGASFVKTAIYDNTTKSISVGDSIASPFTHSSSITKNHLVSILTNLIEKTTDVDAVLTCSILGGGWVGDVYHSWKSSNEQPKKYCLISGIFSNEPTFHIHKHHDLSSEEKLAPLGVIGGKMIYSSLGDTNCVIESLDIGPFEYVVNMGTGSQIISLNDGEISIMKYFPCGRSLLVFSELFSSLGIDMFDSMSKLSAQDVINSTLSVDLNNFVQSRGYSFGGKVVGIREGNFGAKNFFGSIVREMVLQYKEHMNNPLKNKIRLVGGIPKKMPILQDVFAYYCKDKTVCLERNQIENTHIGMVKFIDRWLA